MTVTWAKKDQYRRYLRARKPKKVVKDDRIIRHLVKLERQYA